MKKTILTLGNALNKAEQQKIQGGFFLEDPCSGCPINFTERCCYYDAPCEPVSFISNISWPSCEL
jgi:hypothetical protein